MIVCIAEKPSVARDIASILGATQRRVDQGIGYIEGNGYAVTWTFGHLCTLKEPHDYRPEWKAWSLSSLPIIPDRFGIKAIEIEHYQRQLAVIERLVSEAELVINCGDAGQEGELIQRWVLQKAGCRVPIKRLWISSLTDEAIREGFEHLRDEQDYQSLYEAGLARAIGDWLLGINATRLYTLRYGQRERKQPLSIGRVQTPTLALIVERQQAIEQFKPETYWELKTSYRDVIFSADKGKYTDHAKAQQALTSILGKPFEITSIKKKDGKELPPRLFDLTSLQVACNKKFGMSAEETLATIQSLYEKKLTTYPRVDTTYLSEDLYPKVKSILSDLVTPYPTLVPPLLNGGTIRKSKKVFDNTKVTDHHAIIPTGIRASGLAEREAQVYDLIVRHFIASFYPDCKVSTTSVEGRVERVTFKVSGKEILEPGWRIVFSGEAEIPDEHKGEGDKDTSETNEAILPTFTLGEQGDHTPEIKEKQTQPPKYYTEATLLRAMETAGKFVEDEELREAMKENGIGRPSTRANIIETLFKRGYIEKVKRSQIHATETGKQLISLINYELLKSTSLTGQWEYKLRQIERKELPTQTFINELKDLLVQLTHSVLTAPSAPTPSSPSLSTGITCPSCQRGTLLRGRTAYGCSGYQAGCTYRIPFEECPADATAEELQTYLHKQRTAPLTPSPIDNV
ncbi:DNA topoisomerase 3 [Porphyromonas catoniae]|uniref:DNA topoisomerase 3 n=1 Tax=Porphyromonas catoniae TaxID=41976 RepID=UPI0028D2E4B1|nr:DNA topoisomerase 3 [Porphyromonas catoniae]